MDVDAILLFGLSCYFSAVAMATTASAAVMTTDADVDVATTLSGLFSYSAAVAMATDSAADADANYRKRFFSSCLRSRL